MLVFQHVKEAMMRRTIGGYLFMITGFLACPCHLPLTLPLLLAFFGGTTVGGWLSSHIGLLYGLSIGYFLFALLFGFWWLNRRAARRHDEHNDATCCPPVEVSDERPMSLKRRSS